jgi:hypothetical protein
MPDDTPACNAGADKPQPDTLDLDKLTSRGKKLYDLYKKLYADASGWWGSGCPAAKDLAAWLLWQEGGWLYNSSIFDPRVNDWRNVIAGRHAMVGIMAYLFGDGNITATDLSTMTAFFNPDSGGAFTSRDWAELMTSPPPPPDWFKEVDKYWDRGPYMHNGHRVNRWWTTTEAVQCTQCVIAFSVDISPLANNTIVYFGYIP